MHEYQAFVVNLNTTLALGDALFVVSNIYIYIYIYIYLYC